MTTPTDLQADTLGVIMDETLADVRQRVQRLGLGEGAAGTILVQALAQISADAAGGAIEEPLRTLAIHIAAEGIGIAYRDALKARLRTTGDPA